MTGGILLQRLLKGVFGILRLAGLGVYEPQQLIMKSLLFAVRNGNDSLNGAIHLFLPDIEQDQVPENLLRIGLELERVYQVLLGIGCVSTRVIVETHLTKHDGVSRLFFG